jgi:hypothetical protein
MGKSANKPSGFEQAADELRDEQLDAVSGGIIIHASCIIIEGGKTDRGIIIDGGKIGS